MTLPFPFDPLSAALGFGGGVILAALITWLVLRGRVSALDHQRLKLEQEGNATTITDLSNKMHVYEEASKTQQNELMESKMTMSRLEAEKHALAKTISDLTLKMQHLEQSASEQQNALMASKSSVARLETEKQALNATIDLRARDLAAAQEKFTLHFENLANRIFEEKANKFKTDSQAGLEITLSPLRENLAAFQKKIEDSFGQHVREQTSLRSEIARIVTVNERMTLQAENLANALKGDSKVQGNWGEIILEKILEDSGLRQGVDYILQGTGLGLKHVEDGSALKPDVIVKLPGDRHIIIDAKVSLTHYEHYYGASDPQQQELLFKQFLDSIRSHVTGLAERRYQDTNPTSGLDVVLMFMPIEGALIAALQRDPELHSFAWKRRIVIVCPSTLFATLRTIESMWRLDRQNKNALEIAQQGGALHDKIVGFVEDMKRVQDLLQKTQAAHDESFKKLTTGKGNILKRTHDLRALGIKAGKEIPEQLLDESDDETPESLAPRIASV